MSETIKRLRGLKDLLRDGVEHGSAAIEKVHLETAQRPFAVLEHVPPLSAPTKGIHVLHDAAAKSVYQIIRIVGHVVSESLDVAFDAIEQVEAQAEAGAAGAPTTADESAEPSSTSPDAASEPSHASPDTASETVGDPLERPPGEGP